MLILILLAFVITGAYFIKSADIGMMLSSLMGIYLLLCAYSAIGLFMSCLTSYQVVAALSTLVVFAALQYMSSVWQGLDFVRDITYFLSMASRTETLFYGLVTTRNMIYFLLIMTLFLLFAWLRIHSERKSSTPAVLTGRVAALVVLALAIGYISSRPSLTGYWDVTGPKSNTLSPSTQAMLKSLGEPALLITKPYLQEN